MSGPKNICCDGIFIYCDDSGGGPLWELPREEAIRLFRRWLNDSKREHLEYTRLARKERDMAAAVAKARAGFKVITGANHD